MYLHSKGIFRDDIVSAAAEINYYITAEGRLNLILIFI
jgi:hypothetical protein